MGGAIVFIVKRPPEPPPYTPPEGDSVDFGFDAYTPPANEDVDFDF